MGVVHGTRVKLATESDALDIKAQDDANVKAFSVKF